MHDRSASARSQGAAREPERAEPGSDAHKRFVTQLFERHRGALLRYLDGLLGARADAEDVLQEAYARLLGAAGLERTPVRARAYLFRTATNLAYDRFRRREHALGHADSESRADAETPERILDFEQGLDAVERAVSRLTPRCREVFRLRAVDELDYDVIAARLGISRRTVEREMKRALDVCQRQLRRTWR